MGKQSARLYYQGNDHKDIYFHGKYHQAMYKANQLVWKKILGNEYIVFSHLNKLYVLDLENKQIFSYGKEYLYRLINNEKNLILQMDSENYSDGIFTSNNGTFYRYKGKWDEPNDAAWTTTEYYVACNGTYILKSNYSTGTTKTYYKMYSFLLDQDENIIPNYNVFEKEVSDNLYIIHQSISTVTYNSSKIPFFIYRDSREGEEYTLYYLENNILKSVTISPPNLKAGQIARYFCINNILYIFYQNEIYGDNYNVYTYNFDDFSSAANVNVIEIAYGNLSYFPSFFFLNGKAYIYELSKSGYLYCYETSDFINFKKTECSYNFSVKYLDGDIVNFSGYDTFSFTFPANSKPCGYFKEQKKMEKECMVLFPTMVGSYGLVFMDNMYFNESDGNFGTSL